MKTGTSRLMDSHLVDFTNPNANNIKSGSTQLPQQEISDEEIESAAKECRFEDLDISVGSFELGAKWYREQLKIIDKKL